MAALSESEVQSALADLPGWQYQGNAIQRQFQFPAFTDLMVFVNQLAEMAEEANHHPDLDVRYNRLLVSLTSHDSGGVTRRDVKMAAKISEMEKRPGRGPR
jgi:4a-hydroxytetrahydrobiopterin dehydratase